MADRRARLWFRTLEIWIGTLGQAQLDHRAPHYVGKAISYTYTESIGIVPYTSNVLARGGKSSRTVAT